MFLELFASGPLSFQTPFVPQRDVSFDHGARARMSRSVFHQSGPIGLGATGKDKAMHGICNSVGLRDVISIAISQGEGVAVAGIARADKRSSRIRCLHGRVHGMKYKFDFAFTEIDVWKNSTVVPLARVRPLLLAFFVSNVMPLSGSQWGWNRDA
jgi:hypothetical protein|tara:strand:- start:14799 stop:15263 length:465 start_codon:yes stop_codon:yes gene_type:complete